MAKKVLRVLRRRIIGLETNDNGCYTHAHTLLYIVENDFQEMVESCLGCLCEVHFEVFFPVIR